MQKQSRLRRRLFFAAMSVGVVSILMLLARTASDPDALIRRGAMIVGLAAFGVLIAIELRKGRSR